MERNFCLVKELIFAWGYGIKYGLPHQKDVEAALVFLSCTLNWHSHVVAKKGGKKLIRAA